ncbi:DUF4870 domain-containing protein [Microseira sp. BLCC-F43]|jgi:hypothetical protein|uniref:DUF4870 domain-containing protein n=1 Tax=Microseira sp. BLCC-F43 TaxID=3153602 RepID=UPI0035B86BAD
MEAQEQRKLLSTLCHGSIFFSSTFVSVIIPLVILSVTNDSVVKQNAKEAVNFYINLYIYATIFFFLIFVLIGFPLLIMLGVVSLIMPIIAILQVLSEPDQPYRYPLIFRVV